jgi:structural maintenance of chromosome 2
MLQTVMKDKGKIEATIEELDRHKRDALQKTWEKVNACVVFSFSPRVVGVG